MQARSNGTKRPAMLDYEADCSKSVSVSELDPSWYFDRWTFWVFLSAVSPARRSHRIVRADPPRV